LKTRACGALKKLLVIHLFESAAGACLLNKRKKLGSVLFWCKRPEKQSYRYKEKDNHKHHNGINHTIYRPLKNSRTGQEEQPDNTKDRENI
jgi:hypothetical protein